jgi:hypothetical protein
VLADQRRYVVGPRSVVVLIGNGRESSHPTGDARDLWSLRSWRGWGWPPILRRPCARHSPVSCSSSK